MKKVWLFLFSTLLLLTACFNRRPSAAELQEKIDSVKALEVKRQLRMKGVNIDDDGVSPFRLFYDSLHLQVLPISYSEDYVTSLPDFRTVPPSLVVYLDLEGKGSPKAIALPETLIYEPSRYSSKAMKKDNRDVYFSITSYMEINVMEYIDDDDYEGQLSTYVVDDSRLFVELPH